MSTLKKDLRRKLWVFAAAMGVALLIFAIPARYTAPARMVFTRGLAPAERLVFNAGGDGLAAAGTLGEALVRREKTRATRREYRRLQNRNAALRELILDRQRRLESFNKLQISRQPFEAVSAGVVAYDSSVLRRTITIGAGKRDGVRNGQAVVALGAVVGTVSEVGGTCSRVRLLTDSSTALPARLQRTRELGVLRGTGGGSCTVEWLRRRGRVREGDLLVTVPVRQVLSHQPQMPAGLPLATVARVRPGAEQPLFHRVKAVPRLNVWRLEVVEVLVPTESP